MRAGIDEELSPQRSGHPAVMFYPVWRQGKRLVWGLDVNNEANLQAFLECEEGQAQQVADTVKAGLTLARNGLSALRAEVARQGGAEALMAIKAADLADEVMDQTKLDVKDNVVSAKVTLGAEVAEIVAVVVPAVQQARTAARRSMSMNNLKQIGVAMHNYHDIHKHLPPAVVMGPDGKTPHSWRVEILPLIGQQELYDEYRMNEPWDSEHNKKLLEKIPGVFRCPVDDQFSTNTSYFALTGKGASFEGMEGLRFADFPDGLSNTFLVVESKKAVPWTKPDDIAIDFDKKLPKFGGWYPRSNGFNVLIGDGSVRFISHELDKETLKKLLTRNGGEAIPR
jgi:hypothetical protein